MNLIEFLVSSTYLEHRVFIIRKTICICRFFMVCFFMHLCKQFSRWYVALDTALQLWYLQGWVSILMNNSMSRIRQRYLR